MQENPLLKLRGCGQSVWLDFLSRHLLNSGELQGLIDADGLRGVTSNPAIFDKAISGSLDYDEDIGRLSRQGKGLQEIYETLTVSDVQGAADLFRPIYSELQGADGFVSLEVNPHLAYDTPGTIAEARRLWAKLERPNVFIKVPATREGLPAIRRLIGEGINVNVTLLFGLPRYREVAEAYLSGLEERAGRGQHLGVASVASFFLSRIDTLV
ncbi:MAG TPA: transaldolase, partial [Deltaproteobacteria bacterium]|nr:transaldolase [Deltaproteobacteria bacterium]